MRFAIFGDIHANLEALHAVLADAEAHSATHYVCLGDVVGYNANPHECVEIIQKLECPVVKGNHDEQASIETGLENFNPLAEEAINWTREHLTDEDKQWLRELEFRHQVRDFTIVHATLDTPEGWGYVFNQLDAEASFHHQHTNLCFYGHTHAPRAYVCDKINGSVKGLPLQRLIIEPNKKYFINVGSVGQPRDGDWRAAYCIYSPTEHLVELRRIAYDIDTAMAKILDAGLPPRLAERLEKGK